jgi:hypothetical protein
VSGINHDVEDESHIINGVGFLFSAHNLFRSVDTIDVKLPRSGEIGDGEGKARAIMGGMPGVTNICPMVP